MCDIEDLPDWLTERDHCEDELEDLLKDDDLSFEDIDAIETVLENM